jgi:hypothetical protein
MLTASAHKDDVDDIKDVVEDVVDDSDDGVVDDAAAIATASAHD